MGDVNFTVDFTANRDNFARATQQTVADLNKVGDTAVRQETRQRSLQRFSDQQARAARQIRREAIQTLSIEQQITRLKERQIVISQRLTRATGNEYRMAALRARQAAIGVELRGLEGRAGGVAASATAAAGAAAAASGERFERGLTHVAMHEAGFGHYGRMAHRMGIKITPGSLLTFGGLAALASAPFITGRAAARRAEIADKTGMTDRDVQGLQYALHARGGELEPLMAEWKEKGGNFSDFLKSAHPDLLRLTQEFRQLGIAIGEGANRRLLDFEVGWRKLKATIDAGAATGVGAVGATAIGLARLGAAGLLSTAGIVSGTARDAASDMLAELATEGFFGQGGIGNKWAKGVSTAAGNENITRLEARLAAAQGRRAARRAAQRAQLEGIVQFGRDQMGQWQYSSSEALHNVSSLAEQGLYTSAAEAQYATAQIQGQQQIIQELVAIRQYLDQIEKKAEALI